MPTVNNNKPVDNKQLWQQMEAAPAVSSALSCMTTSEDGNDRFIYYLAGTLFYRHDTYANTWQKLAAPIVTPSGFASIRYAKFGGSRGRIISATATSVRVAGINSAFLDDKTIRIISGAGAGQTRLIKSISGPVIYEQGLATTASANQLGDSTKKWAFNQWAGYQVKITYGTGNTQLRKILYNDATTLTLSDTNYQPIDSFNNQGFAAPIPVVTAGAQAHFVIEATDLIVDAWDVQPDYSSRFLIDTGQVWLLTASTAAPFYSLTVYDVAGDFWITKTASANLILAAFGTDGAIERTGEIGGVFESGTASGGDNFTIFDTTKSLPIDKYINYRIRITGGTGVGQCRRLVCTGATYFSVARRWDINPDNTSTYEIIADRDKIYFGGNAQAALWQHDIDSDLPLQGSKYDDGIANILAARFPGIETPTMAITSGTRVTSSIVTVASAPTAGGTNYLVGDILTISTGGTNGKVIVTSVDPGGIVTGVSLIRGGATYTTGAGKATTGGTGTGCTVNITAIGTKCLVVTAINHNFKIGDQVVISGDPLYAGTVTITGVDSLTQFDFVTAAAGNMAAPNALSATVIVDTTKNWGINEHAGKIVQTHVVGVAGAMQPRIIRSNTATTLTVDTITTALVNGTGRYVITDISALGRDEQNRVPNQSADGHATGGSLTTLIDTTKNWRVNSWVGYKVKIKSGTGRDITMVVTSNTPTTLTYSSAGFTPDATTHYQIQDSYGVCSGAGSTTTLVDTSKNWAVNQWAGKRVRITGGAGFGLAAATNEITIVSNTANTLTFAAITGFAPDATTTYTILGTPVRGAGINLIWMFGGASAGRYMFYPRGGASNTADKYDITTEKYDYGFHFSPQTDTMTTGSAYAYDGEDRVYFSPGVATGLVQYIYYYNLLDNRAYGFGSIPNTQLAPVIGNRLEIINSPAGISYLYHMRNTAAEVYRAAVFF